MQRKYGWGPHPFYFLSGMKGIHPTYVQELMSDLRYQAADVIGVLDTLGQAQSASYRSGSLQSALRFYNDDVPGGWSPRGWSQGRPILLVASGPSVRRHLPAIKNFIKTGNPLVLALNKDTGLPPEFITALIACHPTRLAMDAGSYDPAIPLVVPYSGLPDMLRARLTRLKVLDFGLKIEEGAFAFGERACVVPAPLVAAYALAVAASARAPKIFLAGFDGYKNGDARQNDMVNILERYLATAGAVPVVAITPTNYPVAQASVYDPALS
jgi:4-hydroxy 2-oxovalerate aldolase